MPWAHLIGYPILKQNISSLELMIKIWTTDRAILSWFLLGQNLVNFLQLSLEKPYPVSPNSRSLPTLANLYLPSSKINWLLATGQEVFGLWLLNCVFYYQCVCTNAVFSLRLHIDLWGNDRCNNKRAHCWFCWSKRGKQSRCPAYLIFGVCSPCSNISSAESMQAMRVSAAVGTAGWLAIYFAEVCIFYSLQSFVLLSTKQKISLETWIDHLFCILIITKRGL